MTKLQQIVNAATSGATIASIDSLTDVKLKGGKKNPLQGKVQKETIGSNVMLFQNKTGSAYVNKVRRHLEKEGFDPDSYKPRPPVWGTRIQNTPFVEHKGEIYIECVFIRSGTVTYLVDGVPTNPCDIEGLDTTVRHAKTQELLTEKVIIRKFNVKSIQRIAIGGEVYLKGTDF